MAKTVYLTNEQFENLKKDMIKEEDNTNGTITTPLIDSPDDLNKPIKTLLADFDKNAAAKGIKGKVQPTVPSNPVDAQRLANMNCSKTYSKKQIEEARINKIINNSQTYSKTDFQKTFFNL